MTEEQWAAERATIIDEKVVEERRDSKNSGGSERHSHLPKERLGGPYRPSGFESSVV